MSTPGLVLPAIGARHRLEASPDGATVVRLHDGAVVGRLAFTASADGLQIACVLIDEAARGYGAGSEAVRLLLEAASTLKVATAVAPADQGLPIYFWSRMGFRPLFGGLEGGGIRFIRELAS